MKSPSKYKFHNVLVADTRLLWPMEAGGQQPDVLVLTNKLFKCQPHQTSNCSSCCLHVERPEFRRRSLGSDSDTGSECFADCGRRRSVDVELNAKDQLSGKLVILAFTRIDHSSGLTGSPTTTTTASTSSAAAAAAATTTTKCQTLNTWSFGKFEPNSTISDPKQVSYSRFSHTQSPTMLITSLEISWSPDNQHKELISLTINPNIHHQRLHHHRQQRQQQQQVTTKETLLVSELECYQPLVDNNQNTSFFDETDSEVTTFKVHLLTLINRQLSSASTSLGTVEGSSPGGQTQKPSSNRANLQPKIPAADIASESYIDYPVSASTLVVGRASTPVLVTKPKYLASSTTTTTTTTRAHHRLNYDQPTSTRRPPGELHSGVVQLQVPFLHNKYEFKANESSFMGPSYLSEHDLTRVRLKSNGFLVLAISSSLVILIYTLCLIAYLRWRHRVRSKNRSMAADNAVVPIRKVELDISQPYNLQMPSATRTRLDMMLRGCIVPSEYNNSTSYGPEERLNSTDRPQRGRGVSKSRNKATENEYQQDSISPYYKISHVEERATGGGERSNRKQRNHSNFGSMNVVRAIRQAATLARSRLHLNTRYRPNLNVIFESDLEYLQSPRGELYRGLFNQDNLVYIASPRKSKEAQIDTLVENAMRSDCSHYVDKQQQNSGRMQTTATLFSKPIEETDPSTAVSRSEILRQVKQEDIFGNRSSVRAEL